ncbi:SH3 domain-containing protein [Bacillaceae bacterium CLA-AA-H227]|uniref:SH3 domain-containing protein n=1 Tax=Robertmurraya yapensis (ex Hitch et al 2024) TaxID=3133160 RepID=A0ACC6SEN8_9BACI
MFFGQFTVQSVMAATDLGTENSEANLAIESPEEVDAQIVQITQDAKILNSSGEELGEVLTNTILPVKQIGEGLFEILGELDVINSSDDKLLLKDPSFIVQTEEVASSNCESCTEDNYVEESLSFEQGMTLYQDSEKNTAVMHLNSSLTIPAYYKDQDLIIIKWNEQVYYVETGSTEPSVISDEEPVDVVEEQNSAPSESSVEQSTPYSTEAQQANSSSVQTKVSPSFKATDKYFEVTEDQVVVYDNSGGSLKPVGYLIKGQVYPRVSDYGDWHQIKFGNQYAYVWEAATKVATGNAIQNENKGSANTTRFFIADEDLAVYDNTSGSLVPFAKLNKGIKYPIISDLGDWLKIDVAGRIGYVYSPAVSMDFLSSDKYFEVKEDKVPIYDNSGGSLKPVGYLIKGQVYPRVSDYGDWHQIKFGNQYAYVWKAATKAATGSAIQNENKGLVNTTRVFTADEDLAVYDNTSGSLVPFAKLNKGTKYPLISDMGDWLKIDVAGRIGYVYSPAVSMDFLPSDKYFEVKEDQIAIYDNSGGSLKPVGYLIKGQAYPRVSDYGDWHQIKFGNQYAYVWKAATKVASGSVIQNENKGLANTTRVFTANEDLAVYDNTSGSLVPFAKLNKGMKYPLISDMGDWLKIDVAGRIGYVYSPAVSIDFLPSDKYFEVKEDKVPVYDNSGGTLKPVGYLIKGQVYPKVSDYGDWHQIKFGNQYAYVWEASTEAAAGNAIHNENKGLINSNRIFKVLKNVEVIDTSSGSKIPFATLDAGVFYPIISDWGDWFQVDISGRIGYVYKDLNYIQIGPTIENRYINYNYSLDQFVLKQLTVNPQTDLYYVSKEYIAYLDDATHSPGYYVTATSLNVREMPNADPGTPIYRTLPNGTRVNVFGEVDGWYQVSFGNWRNANSVDTKIFLNPNLYSKYQHLRLDISADISSADLDRIVYGKGILNDKGEAFKEASLKYGVNEAYLVSHALLETGNGTSNLSNGIPVIVTNGVVTIVDPSVAQFTVYNMYGIGAKDSCPLQCGAQTAYDNGWTTPELAIIGGAEFVKSKYIGIGQNTIYKMRWNPDFIYVDSKGKIQSSSPNLGNTPIHQYASDIGWAVKQTARIEKIYEELSYYYAVFDVPVFLN